MPAILFLIVLLLAPCDFAQAQSLASAKQAHAARVANDAIKLDGLLDEAAWRQATPITDFVQKEPDEGAAPRERTEVRIVYDDTSLYIGARMFSNNPAAIQAPMSRRDNVSEAEHLLVSLDTYHNRRTAYTFGVNASGVRLDQYHATDNELDADLTYDPVWQARAHRDEQGWTAEFWIPLTQLRFNESPNMVWGMNIRRYTPTLNEDDYWVGIARTDRGWASRFGELGGFEGVRPRRRIELYPYVAGASRVTGEGGTGNPFDDGKNLEARAGLDMNVALSTNLNLEATFNPDFGQVEADPAEVNLSTFETLFTERRAFFVEGNSLLQGPVNNYYYSRRIGARPTGPATGDFVDYPDTSTILAAGKLTGRLPSGLNLAVLTALTGEENARTYTRATDTIADVKVEPRTFWGVGRVLQEFGTERSTVSTLFTAVRRDLKPGEPLAALLTRRAYSGVADTLLRFGRNAYELDGLFAWSYISGDAAVIERTQRNVIHVLQRPDRVKGTPFDATRTSLGGTKGHLKLSKVTGEHWLWGSQFMFDTPEFDSLDMGRLVLAGDLNEWVNVNYRDTTPGRYLRSFNINTQTGVTFFFDRDLGRKYNWQQNYNFTFLNFWRTAFNWTLNGRGQDPVLTRGGPSMQQARELQMDASLSNSASAQTRWTVKGVFERNEEGDYVRQVNGTFSMRPSPALQISLTPDYKRERSTRQFITQRGGGRVENYGLRSIFGDIERSTMLMQMRLSYTFKPDLNLDFYAEPFAASGRYERIGELALARTRQVRFYGEDVGPDAGGAGLLPGDSLTRLSDGSWQVRDLGENFIVPNRDFKVQSFRSNLVLRWEWRPGTTLYVVWQQDRSQTTTASSTAGTRSLFGSFTAPGDNFFVVKTTYRIAAR